MSRVEMMEFPYGSFLEVRLEFVLLRDNELEAKIMRIIENWMIDQKKVWLNECTQAASDRKPEPPEPDYFVTLSYAQIMAQLYMFNSSRKGVGKEVVEGKKNSIHRNTITKAMTALIEDKYVITRPNPNKTKEYEATQYTLNLPLIQEHMRLLPKNPMSYLGSNGRIDEVACPDFFNPPKEIPCTKFVHGSGDAQKKEVPCTKNVHPTHAKSASPSPKKVHGDAQKSSHLIDREIDSQIDTLKERKNDVNITTSEGSFSHSSTPSSSLVEFTEEEELVYDLAKKKKLSFLSKNKKNKKHCSKLVLEEIATLEQIESLMQFCWQRPYLAGKDLNLGNLAGEVDGWKQIQQSQVSGHVLSSYDNEDYVDDTFYAVNVPDEELAEEVGKFVHTYQEDDRVELYLQDIMLFKEQSGLTNYDMYTRMIEARKKANPEISSMDDFIYELQRLCVGRKVRTA